MFGEIDIVQPVIPSELGGKRLSSPLKPRSVTPTQSYNKVQNSKQSPLRRSCSASKSSNLVRAVFEAQSANASIARSVSSRRQRRWENSNLVCLHEASRDLGLDEAKVFLVPDDETIKGVTVEWRSSLSDLHRVENVRELEAFRSCQPATTRLHSTALGSKRKNAYDDLANSEFDECAVADACWHHLVEKKLRKTVFETVNRSDSFATFAADLEVLLRSFAASHSSTLRVSSTLQSLLVGEAKVVAAAESRASSSSSSSPPLVLLLPLKDSAFHRLIAHAYCQFYGLLSKSISKSSGTKILRITQSKRPNLSVSHAISLTQFLTGPRGSQFFADDEHVLVEPLTLLSLEAQADVLVDGYVLVNAN